jgi:hypothetical protein
MTELLQIKESGIRDHAELKMRIMQLTARKEEQELVIKRNIKELYYSIHPANMIKSAIVDIATGPEWRPDLKRAGLSMGADYLIGRMFGRHMSLKGFISALVVNKLAAQLLGEKDMVVAGWKRIKQIFKKNKQWK